MASHPIFAQRTRLAAEVQTGAVMVATPGAPRRSIRPAWRWSLRTSATNRLLEAGRATPTPSSARAEKSHVEQSLAEANEESTPPAAP
jgi:hypothetical protein